MRHLTMALACAVPLWLSVGSAVAAEAFEIRRDGDTLYSAFVTIADPPTARDLIDAMSDAPLPDGAAQRVLLRSRNGRAVLDLIRWDEAIGAEAYRAAYLPRAEIYWRREMRVDSAFAKEDVVYTIEPGDAVQWSEFLLRDPADLPALSEMVTPMTEAMAMGGAETLDAIVQFHDIRGLSIGLLGRWSDPEGFGMFLRDGTFGDDPYWSDVADNAHWMMDVVAVR